MRAERAANQSPDIEAGGENAYPKNGRLTDEIADVNRQRRRRGRCRRHLLHLVTRVRTSNIFRLRDDRLRVTFMLYLQDFLLTA